MLDLSVSCTYHLPAARWTDEELHEKYQADFLRLFRLTDYDDAVVEKEISQCCAELLAMPGVRDTLVTLARDWCTDDPCIGVAMLFAYPYLHRTHRILARWMRDGAWPVADWAQFHADILDVARGNADGETPSVCLDDRGILRDVDASTLTFQGAQC